MNTQFEAINNVEQIEQKFMRELANGNGGATRRIALAILSHPSEFYYKKPMETEDSEAYLSSIDSITAYISLMKNHLEMMEAARARVFVILQYHLDGEEV